jgi:hypothetical protein
MPMNREEQELQDGGGKVVSPIYLRQVEWMMMYRSL